MSHGGKASGTGVGLISTKPSGSTCATFTASMAARVLLYQIFVVSPGSAAKALIRLSISTADDLEILALKASIAQAEGDLPRAAALLTPLHPTADDINALETQVYQVILERRSAPIISPLKEILAKPDPALRYRRW